MKLSGKTLRNILVFLVIAAAIYFIVSASKYMGIENFDSSSTKVDINWTLILIIGIPVTLYFVVGLVLLSRGSGSAPKRPSAPVANNGNNNGSSNGSSNSGRTSDPGINLGGLASQVNLGGLAGSVANLSGMGKTFKRFQQAQKVGSAVGSVGSKVSGAVGSVGKGISSGYSKAKGLFSKKS